MKDGIRRRKMPLMPSLFDPSTKNHAKIGARPGEPIGLSLRRLPFGDTNLGSKAFIFDITKNNINLFKDNTEGVPSRRDALPEQMNK